MNSETIWKYHFLKSENIDLKNSSIIIRSDKKEPEINSTEQFLKNLVNSKPALFVQQSEDKFIISIGSSKGDVGEYRLAQLVTPSGLGVGATVRKSPYSNILDNDFLDFSKVEELYFKLVVDASLRHLPNSKIKYNSLEKIQNYFDSHSYSGLEVLNKINQEFHLSHLDEDSGRLEILVFKD